MRRSWVQDPVTGKLVPKEEYYASDRTAHYLLGDIEPFVSHVDGSVIRSRKDLREHNARNNVVTAEFDSAAVRQRTAEREALYGGGPHDRSRRLEAIKFAVEANQGKRTKSEIKEMAERYRDRN